MSRGSIKCVDHYDEAVIVEVNKAPLTCDNSGGRLCMISTTINPLINNKIFESVSSPASSQTPQAKVVEIRQSKAIIPDP